MLPECGGVRVLLDVGHIHQLIACSRAATTTVILDRLDALLTRRVLVLLQMPNLGRLGRRRQRRRGGRRRCRRGRRCRGRQGVGVVDEGRVGGRRRRGLNRLVPGGGAVGVARRPVLPEVILPEMVGRGEGAAAVDRGDVATRGRRIRPESEG